MRLLTPEGRAADEERCVVWLEAFEAFARGAVAATMRCVGCERFTRIPRCGTTAERRWGEADGAMIGAIGALEPCATGFAGAEGVLFACESLFDGVADGMAGEGA